MKPAIDASWIVRTDGAGRDSRYRGHEDKQRSLLPNLTTIQISTRSPVPEYVEKAQVPDDKKTRTKTNTEEDKKTIQKINCSMKNEVSAQRDEQRTPPIIITIITT